MSEALDRARLELHEAIADLRTRLETMRQETQHRDLREVDDDLR